MISYRPCEVTFPERHDLHPRILATGRKRIATRFGTVHVQGADLRLSCNPRQAYAWANRRGSAWPCSVIEDEAPFSAILDDGNLVDLFPHSLDLPGDEFDAWCDDTLNAALKEAE